jgi:putative DNA primase/helicase
LVPDSLPPDTTGDDIRAQVEERRRIEAEALEANAKPEAPVVTPRLIKQCLQSNELGDGTLYAALHRGQYLYNKNTAQWLAWKGHHWDIDIMDASFAAVETVATTYLEAGHALKDQIDELYTAEKKSEAEALKGQQKAFYARVKKLRSVTGVNNCLTYSHRIREPIAIKGDEIDTNPWLLAFVNGVLDLRTGKFRDGRPDDYLLKAVPHEWQGLDAPAPTFHEYLHSSLDGPPELSAEGRADYSRQLTEFMLRALGYGITGLSTEQIFLVLSGPGGRNGKGILVETLRYVLGSLAGPIPSEMLLDQGRAKSSSGPSPDIMALKGLRLAFASETDEGRRFSPGQVKWYSGGDTLTGRLPHDKRNTCFDPTHLLILLTNNLPHAPGDDFAFWDRLKLVPFHYSFVADPDPAKPNQKKRNDNLREKLKSEAAGILALLVRGCLQWQRDGLNPPAIVTSATEEYRMDEDTITQFVDECCIRLSGSVVKAADLYKAFSTWYQEHIGEKVPKQKKFGAMLSKQFKKDKVGGVVKYYGLELNGEQQSSF